MEVSFILSEKGKKLLVFGNNKFYKAHVATDGKVRWRCTRSKEEGCPAKLHTASIDSSVVINKEGNHNHAGDPQIAGQATQFAGQATQFSGQATQFSGQAPEFSGQAPQFSGQAPQFSGQAPQFTGQAPQFAGQEPQFAGQEPQFAGEEPQFVGQEPQFAGQEPQFAGEEPQFVGQAPSNSEKRKLTEDQCQRSAKIAHSVLKTNLPSTEITTIDCVRRDVIPSQPGQQYELCNNYQVQATHELHCSLSALNLQLELSRNENRMLKDMCQQNTITFQKQSKAEADKCLAFTGYLGSVITDLQNNLQKKMKIIHQQNENVKKISVENEKLKEEVKSLQEEVKKCERNVLDLNEALVRRTDEMNVISSMKLEYNEKYGTTNEIIIQTDSENCNECNECKELKITTEKSLTLVENYAKTIDELAGRLNRKIRKIHS